MLNSFLFWSNAMLELRPFTFVDLRENGNYNWSQQNLPTLIISNKYFVGTEKLKTKTRYFRLVDCKKSRSNAVFGRWTYVTTKNAQVTGKL